MSLRDFSEWKRLDEANIRSNGWSKQDFTKFRNAKLSLLKKMAKVFEKHGVKWFPDTGTLLGIHRNDSLLDNDNDIDVGIRVEDINQNFFDAIEEMSNDKDLRVKKACHKHYVEGYESGTIKPINKWYMIFLKDRTNDKEIFCDLLVWFPYKDVYFAWDGRMYRHKKEHFERFSTAIFRGMNIRIPNKIGGYLEEMYGEGWETPDSKWKEDKEMWWIAPADFIKSVKDYSYKV
jgi:phosphorylcholine metabolism protein LicD